LHDFLDFGGVVGAGDEWSTASNSRQYEQNQQHGGSDGLGQGAPQDPHFSLMGMVLL
jgi:hypothetical protein